MALTLDPVLAAAQDSQSRRPLCEIISSQRNADIPFDGSFLTSEAFNEFGCKLIPHSSGRLAIAYCYGPDPDGDCGIKYVHTDVARREYTTVTIELYTDPSYLMKAVSLCELTGGNIGLVYLVNDTANHKYRLIRRIITITGTLVSTAEIANWSHDTFTSDPWVQTIAANSYLLVYGKKSGSNYYIYKRTSSDFLTWSAESALSIAGLTATWRLANPYILQANTGFVLCFAVLEATGPGGEELTNLYTSESADCVTWGTAAKRTNYTAYSEVADHPVAVQKVANQMHLIFTRKVGALHMDDSASGWPTGDCTYQLSWDSVNRKLYAINLSASGLECIVKINIDTWAVETYWDETTTPGFPSFLTDATHDVSTTGVVSDGHVIAVLCTEADHRFVWVLDGEANTIKSYYMNTQAPHSIAQNVSNVPGTGWNPDELYRYLKHAVIDAANNRVWLLFVNAYITNPGVCIGYLDLTETTDYQYHSVVENRNAWSVDNLSGVNLINGGFHVDLNSNYLIVTSGVTAGLGGVLIVWDLTTGALIKDWETPDSDFPHFGLCLPFSYNGKIYAGMSKYTSGYSQSSFRGLAEADPIAGTITLYRPTYCSDDDHTFGRPHLLQDGRIAMTHAGYGVAIFDTITKSWELFNNDNIPGMTTDGSDAYWASAQIVYDDTNDLIMVGDPRNYYSGHGLIMFSDHGFIRQAYYMIGTYSSGWTFGAAAQLVQGYLDYDAGACVEPGSSTAMYVFWINEDTEASKSIKWDKDGSSVDISGYLISGEDIVEKHSTNGNPASLSFKISNGHLFDPYNSSSLLSPVLKKGRKLTLRWGENISGTPYWQNAGTYFVIGTSMKLVRGEYPDMTVKAEDRRTLWKNAHVEATANYNNTPKEILDSVLAAFAGLATGDLNIPVFTGSTNLQMQWIDTTLGEIITQICDRFGYFFRFDCDGKAHARPITNTAAIDHIYTDNTKLVGYSQDDKYSDFTNRVTVKGQKLSFTQMTHDEERITQLSGTLGWWGCRAEHVVWFSDDKSRRCLNPRMEVLESAVSIPFKLAGSVSQYLVECDAVDDNKFCTVYVSAPNLVPVLLSLISLYIAMTQPDGVQVGPSGTGVTIPYGRYVEKAILFSILMILGSVINYQIEVWAQPLGSARRSCQATWNDLEHQTEIDAVIEQVITDSLSNSEADCLAVATHEGTIVQMQRRPITFEKSAHLQDEEGDTIQVVHPYSGNTIDLFITDLTRKHKKPLTDGEDETAGFFDTIEGWVVSR